ncbi:hypothetical protein [Clostridium tyrobutyricum]|uniref:hypothetical protein n=1 Tax=Clostridium tyrobutyricum TaxID=1519 RepID=UPI000310147C|nr:hypothetical protein [Clostridium tyrobutyricum]MBV4416522.1 hypothetical protein [Clostridium tyrobutyricum]
MKNKKLIISCTITCIITILIVINVIQYIQNKKLYDDMSEQVMTVNAELKNKTNDYNKLEKELSNAKQSTTKLTNNQKSVNDNLSNNTDISVAEAQSKLVPVYIKVVQKGGNHFTGSFNIVNTNYKIGSGYYYAFQDDRGNSYYVDKSTEHIMYQIGADKTYIDYN